MTRSERRDYGATMPGRWIAINAIAVAAAYAGVIFLGMWITHTSPF
jgi:hypothetical protein